MDAKSSEASAAAKAQPFGNIGAPEPKAKPRDPVLNIYCLKDSREISAIKVLDLGDSYGLKDADGKVITVPKKEVWDIREP